MLEADFDPRDVGDALPGDKTAVCALPASQPSSRMKKTRTATFGAETHDGRAESPFEKSGPAGARKVPGFSLSRSLPQFVIPAKAGIHFGRSLLAVDEFYG